MTKKQIIGAVVLFALVCLAATWLVQGNDFFMYKIFAPLYEKTRRETFEETKSYIQGTIQDLQDWYIEYLKATPSQQDAIGDIVIHRLADFPIDELPSDLYYWYKELKNKKGIQQ